MGTIENGRNKILDVNVLQKNRVKVLGDTPAKETVENYIPMMTWEDWHLLQELHKARAGQSQTVEIKFNGPERKPGMPAAMAAPYGEKKYHPRDRRVTPDQAAAINRKACEDISRDHFELAMSLHNAGGAVPCDWPAPLYVELAAQLLEGKVKIPNWKIEGVPHEVHADLQEKCQVLEQQASDAKRALSAAMDLKNKYLAENRQLSKSLQHYRNAFFSDERDSGGTIPCPPDGPRKGVLR